MGSLRGSVFFYGPLTLLVLACVASLAGAQTSLAACYNHDPYKPEVVMTWGINGFANQSPGVADLSGWNLLHALTGESIEDARQEALAWYKERYGFDNTVLEYDPSTGIAVLPQGLMIPTNLNAQGNYHLIATSGAGVVAQTCPDISVIEWVFFTNPPTPGLHYNGTYGQWYSQSGLQSPVLSGDVFSIGRYLINGSRPNDPHLVLPFKTWYPVHLDSEHTYRVDNVIYHPEYGYGHGQSNYRYYPSAGNINVWSVQIRNTIMFPWIEPPPMNPATWTAAKKK